MVFFFCAGTVRCQSALDGFDPNANGTVRVVVVQPDGKILIGGDFTTLSPNGGAAVTRNRIARLNADGTLDTAFNPNANGTLSAIAVQSDGKVLVGGLFSGANSIGGQTRNRIARLDATTGLADSFDPNANSSVTSIAVQADGKILAGGDFNQGFGTPTIGGQTRNRIARLDATTGLADSFNPNADNTVYAMAVQTDGKVLACGSFTSIGGQPRNRIARLNPDGTPDTAFNPNADNTVYAIAVQADGKILAGGVFLIIGGQTRHRIARLDAATGAADSFNPNANNEVDSIAVQADGKILAGGVFVSIGGQNRFGITRLDATTGSADSFDPNANSPNNTVYTIAVQADGKILAGGAFAMLAPNGGAPVTRNHIARLETDGRLDQTLDLSLAGVTIFATAVQPDGKILIGGRFITVLGVPRNNIARLNPDGTLDTAFNPNANSDVQSIAVQPDGKILVGGYFNGPNSIGGQTRNGMARLDATTGLADSFNPNASGFQGIVFSITVQADGKILAGGSFTSIGGQMRKRIARLDAATGLADSFNPNAPDVVLSIAVQADGKILAGGPFNTSFGGTIGGQPRNFIARLDPTTGLADSFNPNADNWVWSIAVQADGKVLAGGDFASIGGQLRNRIARLDATTGLADSFDPHATDTVGLIAAQADGKILAGGGFTTIGGQVRNGIARLDATTGLADSFDANANNEIDSMAVQADGKIFAGGQFTSIGGQPRSLFARLTDDTAALQNLAVTQNTIKWTRGGSSPQFTRVTFESSTDNVNYTPLGNGTAAGSNWTLSGLNLPTGQNLYIRARGCYRSGILNGSESLTESVRNAFLSRPTRTAFDFDGDGKTDISIFRPGPGEWWYSKSSNGGNAAVQFGAGTDQIVPGDYTGDGKTDIAFWRPSTGFWFILRSEDGSFFSFPFGTTGDVPMPADFDGDGKTDAAVFRPSTSTWFILNSSGIGTTITTFGTTGDVPVTADYDADGKSDIAIYRPSLGQWWINRSSNSSVFAVAFGTSTDRTVPGDYTGDGKADIAFYRPTTGEWFVLRSEDFSYFSFPFGTAGDVPSPGDYDGDGKFDAAVFRPSSSTWFANRSTAGVLIQTFGQAGDLSVPNAFVR